ncbi:hypothetical protein Tco_1401084 [Tanacetum coccineum]
MMMTFLKNMGRFTHGQLKGKSYEELQRLYEKEQKWINDLVPMGFEKDAKKSEKLKSEEKSAGGVRRKTIARKRIGAKLDKDSTKRQKTEFTAEEQESAKSDEEEATDYKQEKEELRMWLKVVIDEEEIVDPEILSTKYPIVDWESQTLGSSEVEDLHVQDNQATGNTRIITKLLSMYAEKFINQYLMDLYKLVMTRFEDKAQEGYNLLLWGDLKMMFEPNAEDEVWSDQQEWTLISWKLYESCGVHSLLLDGTLTCFNMLVEKRYPLIKEIVTPPKMGRSGICFRERYFIIP